jgi:hypothetical protein
LAFLLSLSLSLSLPSALPPKKVCDSFLALSPPECVPAVLFRHTWAEAANAFLHALGDALAAEAVAPLHAHIAAAEQVYGTPTPAVSRERDRELPPPGPPLWPLERSKPRGATERAF